MLKLVEIVDTLRHLLKYGCMDPHGDSLRGQRRVTAALTRARIYVSFSQIWAIVKP
jgi:hypothetical protein